MADLPKYQPTEDYATNYRYGLSKSSYVNTVSRFIRDVVVVEITHLVNKDCICILSVGAGDGIPDLNLLRYLDACASQHHITLKISWTMVEPDPNFMQILKTNMQNTADSLTNVAVDFDFRQEKMEEYISDERGKFDIIAMFHSLYYMSISLILEWCYASLSQPGRLFILVGGKESFYNKLNFFLLRMNHVKDAVVQFFDGESLQAYAEVNKWKFKLKADFFSMDASCIFSENVARMQQFIKALIHIGEFKEIYGNETWEAVVEYTRNNVHYDDNGSVPRILCEDHLFTVMKG